MSRTYRCQKTGFYHGSYFHYTMKVSKGVVKKTYGFLNNPSLYRGLWLACTPLLSLHPARRHCLLRPQVFYSALKEIFAETTFCLTERNGNIPPGSSRIFRRLKMVHHNYPRIGSAGSAPALLKPHPLLSDVWLIPWLLLSLHDESKQRRA